MSCIAQERLHCCPDFGKFGQFSTDSAKCYFLLDSQQFAPGNATARVPFRTASWAFGLFVPTRLTTCRCGDDLLRVKYAAQTAEQALNQLGVGGNVRSEWMSA